MLSPIFLTQGYALLEATSNIDRDFAKPFPILMILSISRIIEWFFNIDIDIGVLVLI